MKRSDARETTPSGRGQLLAVCVPLVCACVVWLVGSRPQTMANVPELPGLAFNQYMVDLQEVSATEEVYAAFDFRNTSAHPITITKLEPSCGCLQPRMRKQVYAPGEVGNFILRVKTALQQPGFKEFRVAVHYTDSEPRTRDVFLRVTFPKEQIYVTPRALTFHQPGSTPVEGEVFMTDLRANPSEILGVKCDNEFVALKVMELATTKQGARRQGVHVTVAGPVPSGKRDAVITIYTNDTEFHELKVPIQIFGPGKHTTVARAYGPQPAGPIRR